MDRALITVEAIRRVRAGRTLGCTLYAQYGDEPSKTDIWLGTFNNPLLASYVVEAFAYGTVPTHSPWVAMGRLVYPGEGAEHIDDFIGCMQTPAVARFVARRVAAALER